MWLLEVTGNPLGHKPQHEITSDYNLLQKLTDALAKTGMLAVGVDLPEDGLDVDGTLGQLLVA